jgi:Dolichyl-phosphate-mannose-protein mannosyltransferase
VTGLPPLSRTAAALAAATLLLHLATIAGYGWFRDEFYYLACAARLDWGYVDHPPAVAIITALTRLVAGDSIVALRFPPAVAHAVTVLLAALLAREMGARAYGQAIAALTVGLAPILLGIASIVSMNAYDGMIWAAVLLVFTRMLRTDEPRAWITLGLLFGVGFENKHSVLFLAFGLVAGIIVAGPRRHLATRWPWIGATIAAVLAAPNVWWEIAHGWPTLEFMRNATANKNVALPPARFVIEQINQLSPFSAPVWIAGLAWLLAARAGAPFGAVAVAYIAILIVFLMTAAKPYYLAAYYPALFAAGGAALERWTDPRPLPRGLLTALRIAVVLVVVIGGAIAVPIVLPVLSEERFIAYQAALGVKPELGERHRQGRLPQFYADMHGWTELVTEVSKAAAQLTPAERRKAFIFAQNYGQAGAVEWLGRDRDLPAVRSGHNNYWLWGPGEDDPRTAIIIGGNQEDNEAVCTTLVEAGRVRNRYAMPYEDDKPVSLCRGLKTSLRELWPELKHFE